MKFTRRCYVYRETRVGKQPQMNKVNAERQSIGIGMQNGESEFFDKEQEREKLRGRGHGR